MKQFTGRAAHGQSCPEEGAGSVGQTGLGLCRGIGKVPRGGTCAAWC